MKTLIAAAAGTLLAVAAIPLAFANEPAGYTTSDETPPSAIEDFAYPGADSILASKGIELKKGDGHILLAECDYTVDQIRVSTVKDTTVGRDGLYCFRATGATGYLTLTLPRVFALEAADHPISADLTANGQTQTIDVAEGGWKSVGEGTVGGARSVLVEIRVTG
ncbi:hypothetical protein [Streptomyces sp. 130]|uniref:hypothetical protein n=1 Tax=Streptomyces sp. 130 TaxID=2591006 RepID=UPI0021B1334B|nr:hypothetical protein [Streptomyces sp. 130]